MTTPQNFSFPILDTVAHALGFAVFAVILAVVVLTPDVLGVVV